MLFRKGEETLFGKLLDPVFYEKILPGVSLSVQNLESFKNQRQLFKKLKGRRAFLAVKVEGMGPDRRNVMFACVFHEFVQVGPEAVELLFLAAVETVGKNVYASGKIRHLACEFGTG